MRGRVKTDLTGKRFGKLTVLERTEQKNPKNRSFLWKCRCDCGNICLKPTNELNSGFAKSCGCTWRASTIQAGRRYGRLTAIEPTEKRNNKAIVWICRCDCGNSIEVRATLLQSGQVASCGCMKAEADKGKFLKNLTYTDDTCIEFLEKISVPTRASSTGIRGVTQKKDGRYQAALTFRKKRYYLGTYKTIEEAVRARKQGETMVEDYLEDYREKQTSPIGGIP